MKKLWSWLKWNARWWFLDFVRLFLGWSMLLLFRIRLYREPGAKLPGFGQPVLLISNHIGLLDPLVMVALLLYRRIRIYATADLFRVSPLFCWILRHIGCIEVDKENFSVACMQEAEATLARKGLVGIFPEGGISRQAGMKPFKCGAVMLALQAGVPVIPIYQKPVKHWWNRRKLVLGKAVNLAEACGPGVPSLKDVVRLSDSLFGKLEELEHLYAI